MPQDKSIDAQGRDINPQVLSTKVVEAKKAGSVMPFDKTTVYATAKSGLAVGEPIEAHPALAEKLIKSGKATKEAPAKK